MEKSDTASHPLANEIAEIHNTNIIEIQIKTVDVILVESPEPNSPYGIKGVGEIGLVPTAGAVAAAFFSYDGQWRTELPIQNIANRERSDAWI